MPPPLPPGVRMLKAGNRSLMTLDGTRSYLVGDVVIDPGPRDDAHLEAILAAVEPRMILLTHAHLDHSGNAEALAARTGAPIRMGRGAPRLPFPERLVDRWLGAGDQLPAGSGELAVLPTPGHAPEHLAFLYRYPGGSALFAGDLFLGAGDTTLVGAPHGEIRAYLESLDKVIAAAPDLVLPAHGRPLRDPPSVVERYRRHRLERIEQLRRERGPGDGPEQLVEKIYGAGLDSRLRASAVASIAAMMEFIDSGAG